MENFQDTYTSFKQSARLIKIGLPEESADCYRRARNGGWSAPIVIDKFKPNYKNLNGVASYLCFPCWSLGRLINIVLKDADVISLLGEKNKNTLLEQVIKTMECGIIDFSRLDV